MRRDLASRVHCDDLTGGRFGDIEFGGVSVMQKAADGEELGVEDGGTGGSADKIVREKGELDVEERTFADASDNGGHAATPIPVSTRLRPIVFVPDADRMAHGSRG